MRSKGWKRSRVKPSLAPVERWSEGDEKVELRSRLFHASPHPIGNRTCVVSVSECHGSHTEVCRQVKIAPMLPAPGFFGCPRVNSRHTQSVRQTFRPGALGFAHSATESGWSGIGLSHNESPHRHCAPERARRARSHLVGWSAVLAPADGLCYLPSTEKASSTLPGCPPARA